MENFLVQQNKTSTFDNFSGMMSESLLAQRLKSKLNKGANVQSHQRRSINQKDVNLRTSSQIWNHRLNQRQIMSQCFNSPVTSTINLKEEQNHRDNLKSGSAVRNTFFSEIHNSKRS